MFADLPFELLSQIALHLPTAQAFRHLALTCRRLRQFVAEEGWRVFVQHRFPSLQPPPYWQDAAHALSTLSRNWDRRALIARYLHPHGTILRLPGGVEEKTWQKAQGQSMGFQPIIDAYDESNGVWASRREVLAFTAGSEMVFRVRDFGSGAHDGDYEGNAERRARESNRTQWTVYKPPGARQGADDVTCLRLLRPRAASGEHFAASNAEPLVFGTASGDLKLLKLPLNGHAQGTGADITTVSFATSNRPVRSIDVNKDGLIAACLSDAILAIYSISYSDEKVDAPPSTEVTVFSNRTAGPAKRLWSTRWLSSNRVAVGLGPSDKPLHIFEVTGSGLAKEPIHKFGIGGSEWGGDDRVDLRPEATKRKSSVYPIVTLPATAWAGHAEGEVFVTGCYDGIIRLYDVRSPHGVVSSYWDPIDDSAIYALHAFGRERLAAGSAQNCAVKLFDLRVSGGRAYDYLNVRSGRTDASHSRRRAVWSPAAPRTYRRGWNLFLSPREATFLRSRRRDSQWWGASLREARRVTESPVYSLCMPSSFSPFLFAGVENNVVQVNFTSMADKYPDPLFGHGPSPLCRPGEVGKTAALNADGTVQLAMYEHTATGGVELKVQTGALPVEAGEGMTLEGYDERWRETKWRR